jgi:hypothetical protein
VTNHPEHDPDIQHIPFFAISKQFFGSLWSTYYKRVMALDGFSKAMISLQHRIYYVVLSLARFNLYANSYGYLAGPKAKRNTLWRFEVAGVAFYWMYFGSILWAQRSWQMRLGYLLVSHIAASPVHVQVRAPFRRADTRLFYPTLPALPRTLDQANHSPLDSFARPWMSLVHRRLSLYTVGCIYKSRIICFLVYLGTTFVKRVC